MNLEERSWDSLARSAAVPSTGESEGDWHELLCFGIGGHPYAVPVEHVREIVRVGPITPIPRVTASVLGVVSLRGEMLQLLDLRQRLGLPQQALGSRARILVVGDDRNTVAGWCVDSVDEVVRVAEDAMVAQVGSEGSGLVSGLCPHGGGFLSVLDLEKVMELDGEA